jgi:hypothetical protein
LVSGGNVGPVRKWRLSTGELVTQILMSVLYSFYVTEDILLCGDFDNSYSKFNWNDFSLIQTVRGNLKSWVYNILKATRLLYGALLLLKTIFSFLKILV